MSFYHGCKTLTRRFHLVLASFLQSDGLPFGNVLPEEEIERAFEEEGVPLWSADDEEDAVYTPPVTLWAFLSQMLHKAEQRSCVAAVARVVVLFVSLGREPPSGNTGAYCRARAKLPEPVIRRLTLDMAMGPYQGKETGELALFRELFGRLKADDIVLGDRLYCSYFVLALLKELGVDFFGAAASIADSRLSARATLGQGGSSGRVDSAGSSRVDGRGDLRANAQVDRGSRGVRAG